MTESELIERARRGVPTAFGELVVRYQDRVYNACYRLCPNSADASDVTQTAFLKALESLRHFDGRASFYTWIFRIAVNLALSGRRSAARRKVLSLDQPGVSGQSPREATGHEPDVSAGAERREMQARVAAALAELDEEFRAAVVLKDIEELDYAEIAAILEVPLGTVKSRIHRGPMMLRELLQDERKPVDRT